MTKHAETLKKLGIEEVQDAFGHTAFRSTSKTKHIAPKILKQYFIQDGPKMVRMYKCEPHPGEKKLRIFNADTYDNMFIPGHPTKMNTNRMKGASGVYHR